MTVRILFLSSLLCLVGGCAITRDQLIREEGWPENSLLDATDGERVSVKLLNGHELSGLTVQSVVNDSVVVESGEVQSRVAIKDILWIQTEGSSGGGVAGFVVGALVGGYIMVSSTVEEPDNVVEAATAPMAGGLAALIGGAGGGLLGGLIGAAADASTRYVLSTGRVTIEVEGIIEETGSLTTVIWGGKETRLPRFGMEIVERSPRLRVNVPVESLL